MGYRSSVALALTAKGAQAMKAAIATLDTETSLLVTDFINYADKHAFEPESKAEAFLWDSVKWYEDYPEVNFFERLMRDLDDEDYCFIRIGEYLDDTEVEGDFFENPFDIDLVRDISFDNRFSMQI